MINTKSARYGDVKSFTVKIDGEDVSNAVAGVSIFQDIFTPVWSAQVSFIDTSNLLMVLPIKQGSSIEVDVETELNTEGDGQKSFSFKIYKIGDKRLDNQGVQTYTAYCTDQALIKNVGTRVRKAFKNKKATVVASNICSEFLGGSLETEASTSQINCIIPGWSPMNAIAWCCKHASKDDAADYVFFQRDSGKFVMKTLETLFDRDSSGVTFFMRPSEIKENGEYEIDYAKSIIKHSWEHFDGLANMTAGYFKNKLVTYDLIAKQWLEHKFTFGQDCAADAQGKNFDFEVDEDAQISFMPKHPEMAEDKPTYLDDNEVWETSRKSSLLKMNQERFLFQVPGSIGANEWIGKNCEVDLPSHEDMTDEPLDKHRKGKYLIVAIHHHITKESYLLNIEGVKKRLEESV